ncbi:hypothetical protein X977_3257 [Burkholderia pseudomallei MSHR7504]|nr:hypothetical protein X977_3257 [Burkholderia pseudomallei MSHR7504]
MRRVQRRESTAQRRQSGGAHSARHPNAAIIRARAEKSSRSCRYLRRAGRVKRNNPSNSLWRNAGRIAARSTPRKEVDWAGRTIFAHRPATALEASHAVEAPEVTFRLPATGGQAS